MGMAQVEPGGDGMMTPRRFATLAACGTVFAVWAMAGLAGSDTPGAENTDAAPIADGRATSVTGYAAPVNAPQAAAMDKADVSGADAVIAEVALPGASPEPPPEEPPVQVATLNTPDPLQNETRATVPTIEIVDECLVAEICINEYLWAVYERTAKVDTNTVVERRKVTVKKNGKTRTVVKSSTKLVDQDFTWKDPKAAERAGMSMKDYVIGGMDRAFKLKLFRAVRAMEDAGLAPGMTSAFRDDYRQSIASGLKAATDRSYHGGSFRGGYGHGLAADLVSVKGETRGQRWISSEILWKWIDAHGAEYGVGRPYLDRDPPHVGPIDGKEYTDRRGAKTQHAKSEITQPKPMSETGQSRRIDDSLGMSASPPTPEVLSDVAN
jgi:hypothetical protein